MEAEQPEAASWGAAGAAAQAAAERAGYLGRAGHLVAADRSHLAAPEAAEDSAAGKSAAETEAAESGVVGSGVEGLAAVGMEGWAAAVAAAMAA